MSIVDDLDEIDRIFRCCPSCGRAVCRHANLAMCELDQQYIRNALAALAPPAIWERPLAETLEGFFGGDKKT